MTARPDAQLVLLHGVGLDRSMWDSTAAALGRPVVALDLPGHGAEPRLEAPQTLASLAADVLARMPGGAVDLVGFSLGALVAQRIAIDHPERVRTLVCVSSVCRRTPGEQAAVRERLARARADLWATIDASIARWFPEGAAIGAADVARTRATLEANDPASFVHAYEVFATGDADVAGDLGRIAAPTLAITGELDPGSTPEMSHRLAEAVLDGRAVAVAGARHMLPLEQPGVLAEAIAATIDRTDQRGG